MSIKIRKVKYFEGYKLKITFNDGKTKIVDFENWISEGGFYLDPLKDLSFFKQVSLDDLSYTICWPNGADFCPDVLYMAGQEIKKSKSVTKRSHPRITTRKKTKTAR